MLSEDLIVPALIAAIAGTVRGITGFGGAMVMTPPLALLLGPQVTVPVVLLVEALAGAPQVVQTHRLVHWRVLGPIFAATCATVPLGGYLLVTVDAETLRRAMALIVIVFALVLLGGWRYDGPQRTSVGVALGGLSGGMLGATSIGAPPVILYLLAGPDRIEITRANLTLFVTGISSAGVIMLWIAGLVHASTLLLALVLAPAYFVGLALGIRLFARFNERRFRRFALLLIICVAAGTLLA